MKNGFDFLFSTLGWGSMPFRFRKTQRKDRSGSKLPDCYGPPIQTVHVMQWGQRNTTLAIRGIKVKWMLWGNIQLGKTARQSHPIALHILCSSLWGWGASGGQAEEGEQRLSEQDLTRYVFYTLMEKEGQEMATWFWQCNKGNFFSQCRGTLITDLLEKGSPKFSHRHQLVFSSASDWSLASYQKGEEMSYWHQPSQGVSHYIHVL